MSILQVPAYYGSVGQDLGAALVSEDLSSPFVSQNLGPTLVRQDLSAAFVGEDFSASLIRQNLSPALVGQDLSSPLVRQNLGASLVGKNFGAALIRAGLRFGVGRGGWSRHTRGGSESQDGAGNEMIHAHIESMWGGCLAG